MRQAGTLCALGILFCHRPGPPRQNWTEYAQLFLCLTIHAPWLSLAVPQNSVTSFMNADSAGSSYWTRTEHSSHPCQRPEFTTTRKALLKAIGLLRYLL